MKFFKNILREVEVLVLILFCLIIFRKVFLISFDETDFTVNVYFLMERTFELLVCIVGFNLISKHYRGLGVVASSIAAMSFLNEMMHTFGGLQLNNPHVLITEFAILIIIIWVTASKIFYS